MDTTTFFRSCAGVFQGGGCRAAALVGAFEEAVRRGVSFTEVAGTSAGSIVAALIGAGASPKYLRDAMKDLDFRSFLRPAQIVQHRGIKGAILEYASPELTHLLFDQGFYSSSKIFDWLNEHLNKLLPDRPHPISFQSLPIPTYVVSTDLILSKPKIWSQRTTPIELVASAVQASCAIPIFFQPVQQRYVDGGVLSNLPSFVFSDKDHSDRPLSSRVLAFTLIADEEPPTEWSTSYYLKLLLSAVVDGSQNLQIDQQRSLHIVKIPTGNVKATDFDKMTPEITQTLIENGRNATKQFFDEELARVRSSRSTEAICYGVDELYTHITDGLDLQLKRVVIAENNTSWVYSLFPTLLCWRMRGIPLQVVLPQYGDKEGDGAYRRKLLRALGCQLVELQGKSSVPFRIYVLDTIDQGRIKAAVGVERGVNTPGIEAVIYSGLLDRHAIVSMLSDVDALTKENQKEELGRPSIVAGRQDQLVQYLKAVGQYSKAGIDLTLENVRVDRLLSLTRFVREYKYKQIHHLVTIYDRNDIPIFSPSHVQLLGGKSSILTPPVVEATSDRYVLIEGSTRATYCRDSGIDSLKCVVVRNVKDPLPSRIVPFSEVRVIGRTLGPSDRYEEFDYDHFRPIENNVHPLDSLD